MKPLDAVLPLLVLLVLTVAVCMIRQIVQDGRQRAWLRLVVDGFCLLVLLSLTGLMVVRALRPGP